VGNSVGNPGFLVGDRLQGIVGRPCPGYLRTLVPFSLVLLTVLCFLPALDASFVGWDDDDLLFNTESYRTLSWASLRWMFSTSFTGHWQPLTWLSFTLDWHLWGRESFGYHLTSVTWHSGTALGVYFIARRMLRTSAASPCENASATGIADSTSAVAAAGLAAAFFAIHPLRAESVAWIAERRDVLSGFFFVFSILFYLRYTERCPVAVSPRNPGYLASFSCFGISLLAKANATMLPLVLLILDFYPLRRLNKGDGFSQRKLVFLEKVPFLVLAVVVGLRAVKAQSDQGALSPLSEHDFVGRFAQATYGFVFYPLKTFLPTDLSPLYQLPARSVLVEEMLSRSGWLALGLVGAATLVWNRRPAITAALASYAVMIAPVLGFAQSGPQWVADRYSYLSCLGFAALVGAGFRRWFESQKEGSLSNRHSAAILAAIFMVAILFHGTRKQTDIWRSALTLWSRGVAVSQDSFIAHVNLADALATLGDHRSAILHYRRALELCPRDVIASHHLAETLATLGDVDGATAMLEWTMRLSPLRSPIAERLAELLLIQGKAGEAVALLRDHARRQPYDARAIRRLADLLSTHPDASLRNGDEALHWARQARIGLSPLNGVTSLTLATALAESGRFAEAVVEAEQGIELARAENDSGLVEELERRAAMFRREQPFRRD